MHKLKIQKLREALKTEVANRDQSTAFYDRLVKRIFKAKLERLNLIEKILDYPKHKVAVIGTVGAGKTTAICHLFNLVDEVANKNNIFEIQELLKTGPGYTTICEVVLKEGGAFTSIELEPYSQNDLESLIIDFCDFIHEKMNPDNEDKPQTGKNLISPEVDRALRNIVNLKTGSTDHIDEKGKKRAKSYDKAKELYTECNGNLEDFKDLVLERALLEERTTTMLEYNSTLGNEKKWLKSAFEDLNGGKRQDCSMPKRIYINIGKEILENSRFSQFSSIIDTKGLDANENRRDLDDHIKDEETICVFTTGYKDAPDTNIRKLLSYYFADKSANYQTKFIILVLPKKGEPESEQDAEGDRETGINTRREIIQNILQGLGINELSDDNIIFYDALNHYDSAKNNRNADHELIAQDKEEVIELLNDVIGNRRLFFEAEFDGIKRDFDQIVNGQGLTEDEGELIDEMYKNISEYKNLNFHNSNEFADTFITDYKMRYAASTMKAIHRRYGIYTGIKDNNMYYDAQRVAEDMVRNLTKGYNRKISDLFDKLKQKLNNADLTALIEETKTQFVLSYNKCVNKVAAEIHDFLFSEKLNSEEKEDFWNDVINTRGTGYKNNVGATFRDELESKHDGLENVNDKLKKSTEEHWEKDVIAVITNFFKR